MPIYSIADASIPERQAYEEYRLAGPQTSAYGSRGNLAVDYNTWRNRQDQISGAGGSGVLGASAPYMDQMQQFASGINPAMGANRFESGLSGMENRLTGLLDDPTKIKETAAYKFRTGQGEQALNRQMAAKGMLGSGNRLMDLMKYGQDMASQEYDAQLGRLQGLVGMYGQNWNQAQGTNVNQYLGEMGQKRNALSDLISGANVAQGQANQYKLGTAKLSQDAEKYNLKGWG